MRQNRIIGNRQPETDPAVLFLVPVELDKGAQNADPLILGDARAVIIDNDLDLFVIAFNCDDAGLAIADSVADDVFQCAPDAAFTQLD